MSVLVKCIHCGKEQIVNFGYCLGKGWPKCCKYTMRLMTKAKDIDIDGAVSKIVGKAMLSVNNQGERTQ